MRYRGTIEVRAGVERAFAYLADFSNASDWDRATLESSMVGAGPVQVGTEFDLLVLFRKSRVQMRYRITELEQDRRVVLVGEGRSATAVDVITFEPTGTGCRITYDAEVRLKGLRRIGDPFLRGTFDTMGREALAGIAAALNRAG
jgi:carbon monoxide dehydrogenase subunit G